MPIRLKMIASSLIKRDIEIALGVFDHLGGFGHFDARRLMGAGDDDLAIELIDQFRDFRRGAGGDLLDRRDAVQLVARIDALRAVAGDKNPR